MIGARVTAVSDTRVATSSGSLFTPSRKTADLKRANSICRILVTARSCFDCGRGRSGEGATTTAADDTPAAPFKLTAVVRA